MPTLEEQAATGVVVGMKALTGEIRPRYDIDVLLDAEPNTFNLFLQAMAAIQRDPGVVGYYQIAGIHGLPTNTWDGVKRVFKDTFGGYCAHGVLVFPTWHRPYLALMEQTLYLKMVELAKGYDEPHRQTYVDAAKKFRLPYLDYFRPRDGEVEFPGVGDNGTTKFRYNFQLPEVFNVKRITVLEGPGNTPTEIDNPLYTYKFTPENGELPEVDLTGPNGIEGTYNISTTVRYPETLESTEHDAESVSWALNSGREGRSTMFLNLINSRPYATLVSVASDLVPDGDSIQRVLQTGDMTTAAGVDAVTEEDPKGIGSLEGTLHGNYHGIIGGNFIMFDDNETVKRPGGHMCDPRTAAFDPVFWFHHCQIDRAWTLWQTMHPKAWFPQPKDAKEQPENKKDLLPFYKSRKGPGDGDFYSSDDAKTTEVFGYIYDDFVDLKAGDKDTLWANLQAKYTWATRTPDDPKLSDPPAEMKPKPVSSSQFFQPPDAQPTTAHDEPTGPVGAFSAAAEFAATVTSNVVAVAEPATSQAQAAIQANPEAFASLTTSGPVSAKFDRECSAANGIFTIFFFLAQPGEVTTDPRQFMKSPYLAGVNHIFAAPREVCDNCGDLEAAGSRAGDTIPITPLLLDYMHKVPGCGLASLRPEEVRPFLVKYLRWRVVYGLGGLTDPRNVPEFEVGVSAKVCNDDGSSTYETYPDIVPEILRNASDTCTSIERS